MYKTIQAKAPSNIALIKYWGKKSEEEMTPLNPSISITLSDLWTYTSVNTSPEFEESWIVIKGDDAKNSLNARILRMLSICKEQT